MSAFKPGDLFEVAKGPRARAHIVRAVNETPFLRSWCGRAYARRRCRPVAEDYLTWTECKACVRAEKQANGGTL